MVGIYKIESPSGRIYVGQSSNIESRFKGYIRMDNSIKSQKKLYNSFIKYGVENHKFHIICECALNELEYSERYYIKIFDSVNKGLNITGGGKSLFGENNPFYGRRHSDEVKKKIGLKMEGKPSPFKNKHHTESTKRICREYRLTQTFTEEAIQKMRIANVGRKHSPETLLKLSIINSGVNNAMYGKTPWNKGKKSWVSGDKHPMFGKTHPSKGKKRKNPVSQETRQRMSEAAKERCKRIGPPKRKANPS